MNYYATSPIPTCNEIKGIKLSDMLPFSVFFVFGYDIRRNLLDMQRCLIMPAAMLCQAASYTRPQGNHCYTLADDTLLISGGCPVTLSDVPDDKQKVASMGVSRPEAKHAYQNSLLVKSEGLWHRLPLMTTPEIMDLELELVTSSLTMPPQPAIRLLCPEGFYPVLGGELILGTELLS